MGGTSYDYHSRSVKTSFLSAKDASGNYKVTRDQIFEQNKKKAAHASMIPNKANKAHLRESRDSETHPHSVPIIIVLDVTGSMGDIPDHLIREGLPKMVSKIMELGVKDPQIMIMAVGDSRYDNNDGVFQLGQFESGDVEMDMWLERIWVSGGGGGNHGESYNWAYYYAANHIQTDAWDKRKQKGFIFTIGDDHCHEALSSREIEEYMGEVATSKETAYTKDLVDAMKERWNIYHLELGYTEDSWKRLLGSENVIKMGRSDYDGMGNKIAEIVASYTAPESKTAVSPNSDASVTKAEEGQEGKTQPTTPIL